MCKYLGNEVHLTGGGGVGVGGFGGIWNIFFHHRSPPHHNDLSEALPLQKHVRLLMWRAPPFKKVLKRAGGVKGQRLTGALTIDDKLESLGKTKRNREVMCRNKERKVYILHKNYINCSFLIKLIQGQSVVFNFLINNIMNNHVY